MKSPMQNFNEDLNFAASFWAMIAAIVALSLWAIYAMPDHIAVEAGPGWETVKDGRG